MNVATALWPNETDAFFRGRGLHSRVQEGATCVATSLAIVSGCEPAEFRDVNTQNPVEWSDALRRFGMKLAYLPTDIRPVKFYIDELLRYDDLFVIGFYSNRDGREAILRTLDENGWLCASHMVVLHRDQIYDPARGTNVEARLYDRLDSHTKRIFRVVPADHPRGL